jgi:hypothetical protein
MPDYADRLWDFQPFFAFPSIFRLREFRSEEELFDARGPVRRDEGSRFEIPGMTRRPGSPTRLPFPEAVERGSRLWSALPDALRRGPGPSLDRIKISTTAERIVDLPWECLSRDGLPLALDPNVRLVRSVPVRYSVPPLTVVPPIRVLIAVTNPKDERLLQADWETHTVAPENLPGYEVQHSQEPTPGALRRHLASFQPHVVHYIGHSACEAGQGHLILHDDRQYSYWLGAAELAALLPATVRLLCLSTCFSARNYDLRGLIHLAHAASDVALPSVVTNVLPLEASSQPTIRAFWNAFYSVLMEDCGDMTSAVHEGRRAAAAADAAFADWASFALVIRDVTGWGLRIQHAAQDLKRKEAELEALFASRLANNLSYQSATLPPEAQKTLLEHSRAAASEADSALSSFGGFDLPRTKRR